MSRPKLLLADDSIAIRKVIELTFADEDMDVFAVADAPSAMQKFVEVQPDIVLVDAGLDGTSGYQICEMIKSDPATSGIPVLLLIGSFEPLDDEAVASCGADGVLTKPFRSIRELIERVSGLVKPPESPTSVSTTDVDETEVTAAPATTADTDDIEDLYKSSFAETVEIDRFDTLEDLTGDDEGLDDELIEAVNLQQPYPAGEGDIDPKAWAEAGAEEEDPPIFDDGGSGASESEDEQVKGFDWSPAAKVDDGDGAPDEAAESMNSSSPAVDVTSSEMDVMLAPQETKDLSWDANDTLELDIDNGADKSAWQPPAIEEPILSFGAQAPQGEPQTPGFSAMSDPSPELISILAQRVVERLSDRVIREVAQEAVPRIAEKLIREALEEEPKS